MSETEGAPTPLSAMRLCTASTFWQRLVGLLGRKGLDADEALLIIPCNNVHTCFMRFSIDVVFLDRDGAIVATVPRLRPWRIAASRPAHACLELAGGGIERFGLKRGQQLPKLWERKR